MREKGTTVVRRAETSTQPASESASSGKAPGDYGQNFPGSRRVYVEGRQGVRVPMREIELSGGEPPLRVYDTSGPLGIDVQDGLPGFRTPWIQARGSVVALDPNKSSGAE